MNRSKGIYFVKRNVSDTFVDITDMFDGVAVLSLDGLNELGEALNVYHAQWVDSQTEDFLVTTKDANNNDVIIRSNVDLNLTLVISERYKEGNESFVEDAVYDKVIDYICNRGAFYIRSDYAMKTAKVVCLGSVKPTAQKMKRGVNGYILVTIPLHKLDANLTMREWRQLIDSNNYDVIDKNDMPIEVMDINQDPTN